MNRFVHLDRPSDATLSQRCCDLFGKEVNLSVASRNHEPMPQFPSSIFDSEIDSDREDTAYSKRKNRILRDLDPLEQAIFLLLHEERCSRTEAARQLGISRPTLYAAIARMLKKSKYCRISAQAGCLKPKRNQHE